MALWITSANMKLLHNNWCIWACRKES